MERVQRPQDGCAAAACRGCTDDPLAANALLRTKQTRHTDLSDSPPQMPVHGRHTQAPAAPRKLLCRCCCRILGHSGRLKNCCRHSSAAAVLTLVLLGTHLAADLQLPHVLDEGGAAGGGCTGPPVIAMLSCSGCSSAVWLLQQLCVAAPKTSHLPHLLQALHCVGGAFTTACVHGRCLLGDVAHRAHLLVACTRLPWMPHCCVAALAP